MAGAFRSISQDDCSEWYSRLAQQIEDGQRVDVKRFPRSNSRIDALVVGQVERALANEHAQVMELAKRMDGFAQSYHLMKLAIQYQHADLFFYASQWIDWDNPNTQVALLHVCGFYHGHMFAPLAQQIKTHTPWRARLWQCMGRRRRPVPLMERSSFMMCVFNHHFDLAQTLLERGIDREQWMVTIQRAVDRQNMPAVQWLWSQPAGVKRWLANMTADVAFVHLMKLMENNGTAERGLERDTLQYHLDQLGRVSGEGITRGLINNLFGASYGHFSTSVHQYGFDISRRLSVLAGAHPCIDLHFLQSLEQRDGLIATSLWPVVGPSLRQQASVHRHCAILSDDPEVWSEAQTLMMRAHLNAEGVVPIQRGVRKI